MLHTQTLKQQQLHFQIQSHGGRAKIQISRDRARRGRGPADFVEVYYVLGAFLKSLLASQRSPAARQAFAVDISRPALRGFASPGATLAV